MPSEKQLVPFLTTLECCCSGSNPWPPFPGVDTLPKCVSNLKPIHVIRTWGKAVSDDNRTFSGFRSQCTICLECKCFKATIIYNETTWTPLNEPHHKKTCLQGFRSGKTGLCSWWDWIGFWNFCYILSRQQTRKALIRLRGCAGWSAPLLFANGITGFHMT